MLALALVLAATTIPPLTPAQLVERSDVVAKVVVRAHRAEWIGQRILTFYDVDVVELWRGTPALTNASHLEIALPGGVVGDLGQKVAGTPSLVDGASYVLCLGKASAPHEGRAIIGLWQGAWSVAADSSGGRVLGVFTHDGPRAPVAGEPTTVDELRATLTAVPR
jgi:hypothetical protein